MFHPHNAFTLSYSARATGLITSIKVTLPNRSPQELDSPPFSIKEYRGLWDTGATNSVITEKIVEEMGLKSIGRVDVHHANGTTTRDSFLVDIILPNNTIINAITVVDGILTGFDVLIGMDIITLGDYAITNKNGKTKMTYRLPSCVEIDFVPETNEYNYAMRNGSKKLREQFEAKYK